VLLGAAMLGGVAGGRFENVRAAMASMSQISKTYEPDRGDIAALHEARFRAFKQLQSVAREIRRAHADPRQVQRLPSTV
jgi:D-ribulokinase